jgi:hypothetical protein
VVGLLGGHAADDGEPIGAIGKLRQVFADANTGNFRIDRLHRAAVVVPRLRIEGVELARPAVHPQQDAGPFPLRVGATFGGQPIEPAREADADGGRARAEEVAPIRSVSE